MSDQEERELKAIKSVHSDHENRHYDTPLDETTLPLMGNAFYIYNSILLIKLAKSLSRFAELKAVEITYPEPAYGWSTGLTTILIKKTSLHLDKPEFDPQDEDLAIVERDNLIKSKEFREQFGLNWPKMALKYTFTNEENIHNYHW